MACNCLRRAYVFVYCDEGIMHSGPHATWPKLCPRLLLVAGSAQGRCQPCKARELAFMQLLCICRKGKHVSGTSNDPKAGQMSPWTTHGQVVLNVGRPCKSLLGSWPLEQGRRPTESCFPVEYRLGRSISAQELHSPWTAWTHERHNERTMSLLLTADSTQKLAMGLICSIFCLLFGLNLPVYSGDASMCMRVVR